MGQSFRGMQAFHLSNDGIFSENKALLSVQIIVARHLTLVYFIGKISLTADWWLLNLKLILVRNMRYSELTYSTSSFAVRTGALFNCSFEEQNIAKHCQFQRAEGCHVLKISICSSLRGVIFHFLWLALVSPFIEGVKKGLWCWCSKVFYRAVRGRERC